MTLTETLNAIRAKCPTDAEYDALRKVVECDYHNFVADNRCPHCLASGMDDTSVPISRATYWEQAEERDPGVLAGALLEQYPHIKTWVDKTWMFGASVVPGKGFKNASTPEGATWIHDRSCMTCSQVQAGLRKGT